LPYNEQSWRDGAAGGTPLSSERLKHIEAGIGGAHTAIDVALRDLEAVVNEIKVGLGQKVNDTSRFVPAGAFSGGGTLTTVPGTTVPALSFPATANVTVSTLLDLPDDWPTAPHIHLLWAPGDTAAGDVVWRAGVQSYDAESLLGTAAYSADVAQPAGGAAAKVRVAAMGSLNVDPLQVTNLVVESRAAEAADTYTGTRYLLGVRLWKTVQVLPPDPSAPAPAADIAPTVLTSAIDNVNRSSYTTASVAPAASRLLMLPVFTGNPGTATAPLGTPTGLGLTWTKHADQPFSSDNGVRRLTWWAAQTGGTAPTPGAITIDCGGVESTHAGWGLIQVEGAHDSMPIVQPTSAKGSSSTLAEVTLAPPLNTKSRVFAAFAWRVQQTATPRRTPGRTPAAVAAGAPDRSPSSSRTTAGRVPPTCTCGRRRSPPSACSPPSGRTRPRRRTAPTTSGAAGSAASSGRTRSSGSAPTPTGRAVQPRPATS
jgi:hypothetical protein